MKELTHITDYQAEALKVLLTRYKDSLNLQGIMSAKSHQMDDLEEALFEIRDLMCLDTSEGAQLDIQGRIWDVARLGRADTIYRLAIYAKISLKISGTIPEIIALLKSFYGATYAEYHPQYPAKHLYLTDADIDVPTLEKISPAGVGVIIKDKDDTGTKVFGFHATGSDSRFAVTHNLEFIQPQV